MRIIFDLRKVGLGNNGGSSTLIKSGNTLVEMGHKVFFVDSMRNKHTWTKLKAKHIRARKEKNLPDADLIIATGYNSVGPTVKAPDRCGHKAHWIRAWEHWQMSDAKIIENVLKAPTIKLVNSLCLRAKLNKYGFKSHIIRPGYDFDELFPKPKKEKKDIVIAGLNRQGIHGQRKRTQWLKQAAWKLKSSHKDLKFWMFGSEPAPSGFLCDKYLRSPSMKQKNDFYNNVDIWMAPTMSEGLHLPPAEAMITGCPVVATTAELSGTQDYVVHGMTGFASKDNLNDFIKHVNILVKNKGLRKAMGEKARKKILSLGDRKENMQKLIDLFMEK